ncbi:MAG: hypothetical protein IKC87_04280 [Clostridia bacterium]|nr:hypothetical protein [Clostridia bacterium]
MEKYDVLIVAGPSGVGKTAVAKAIIESDPRFTFLRSATTRPIRSDGNKDEYLYCTEDEFRGLIERGEMLEHMVYDGCMYGTPKSEVERAHGEGKIPLLVLDLNGVDSLFNSPVCHTCAVFLYADGDTVNTRLSTREGSTPERVASRKVRNREDYLRLPSLAYAIYAMIPNDKTLNDCRDRVVETFRSFVSGVVSDKDGVKALCDKLASEA